jgi:peptide/nickel transport system permease protein
MIVRHEPDHTTAAACARHGVGHRRAVAQRRRPRGVSVFLLKRFATFVATLLAASLVVFFVLEILPGNAAEVMLGPTATPDQVAALSKKLGLDRPAGVRYLDWLRGLATGELGTSVAYDTPVSQLLLERLAVSLPLAVMAMLLTTVIALVLGVYAASRHNRLGDVGVMAASQLGIAIPNFWFAILLILFFAVKLQWFSAGGFPGWDDGVRSALAALVLPAIALAVVQAAILARITRSAVLEVMREDYIRTAWAKGQNGRVVIWRHALKNAMLPVITVIGIEFAFLIGGLVVTETVFNLPGVARFLVQAILWRDYPIVQNLVMFIAIVVILSNLAVDMLYGFFDPRVRYGD